MWPSQAKIGVRRAGVILGSSFRCATLMCFGSLGGNPSGVIYPGLKVDSGERDTMRPGRKVQLVLSVILQMIIRRAMVVSVTASAI